MDIRTKVFSEIADNRITACITTDVTCILAGAEKAAEAAHSIGLEVDYAADEGSRLVSGDLVLQISGSPVQIAEAEDTLIGLLAKTSGVATAAGEFVKAAAGRSKIVCGSWKKMPGSLKKDLRKAVCIGGASCRISEEPMLYMDKNYVAMLGGIQASMSAGEVFEDRKKAIQIRGRYENGDIVREAWAAIHSGADIVYIDTGRVEDAEAVLKNIKPVLEQWKQELGYREVRFAFGGGVTLDQIPYLCEIGVDIIGVGRPIIDAPLADMRLDVTAIQKPPEKHHSYRLLDKSELTIENIRLNKGNLNQIAAIVAEEIGVPSSDVLVIDVRDDVVALDILQKELDPHFFVGKEQSILSRLAASPGVCIGSDTRISSRGMLGWIVSDEDIQMRCEGMEAAEKKVSTIKDRLAHQAIVFPTGTEVEKGEIEDTNTPLLMNKLAENGFTVTRGEILKDDIDLFSGKLRRAVERGYGLIVTTGGVGAEDKDHSVEAILRLDKTAAAPYIVKFKPGEGRHRKEGIRIGVGQVGCTTLVALPGPNDEVTLCSDTLIKGVTEGWSKEVLAAKLALTLRKHLLEKMSVNHAKHHKHQSRHD